jgi:hypothetical protein
MKKIVLGALFALGLGLAGVGGASAAVIGGGIANAAPNYSPIVQVAYGCRRVTVCHREYGHRHCHTERVCRR